MHMGTTKCTCVAACLKRIRIVVGKEIYRAKILWKEFEVVNEGRYDYILL